MGDRFGVKTERGAGQCPAAIRGVCRAPVPVLEALHVAKQGPTVGLQVVSEQDRLCVLQVRPAWHRHLGVCLGLTHQRLDDF